MTCMPIAADLADQDPWALAHSNGILVPDRFSCERSPKHAITLAAFCK